MCRDFLLFLRCFCEYGMKFAYQMPHLTKHASFNSVILCLHKIIIKILIWIAGYHQKPCWLFTKTTNYSIIYEIFRVIFSTTKPKNYAWLKIMIQKFEIF